MSIFENFLYGLGLGQIYIDVYVLRACMPYRAPVNSFWSLDITEGESVIAIGADGTT